MPWPNLPTHSHDHVICMGKLGGNLLKIKYSRRSHRDQQTIILFPYKQIIGRHDDHQLFRMTNAFILCELLWKVQKSHAVNREGSFNVHQDLFTSSFVIIQIAAIHLLTKPSNTNIAHILNTSPVSTGPVSTGPVSAGPVSTSPVSTGHLADGGGIHCKLTTKWHWCCSTCSSLHQDGSTVAGLISSTFHNLY